LNSKPCIHLPKKTGSSNPLNGGPSSTASKSQAYSDKVHRLKIPLKVDLEILLKGMPDLIEKGTVQQAIQLLPYIPNILIKLGGRGVLSVRLRTKDSIDSDEKGTLRLRGGNTDICVRYHPGLKNSGIVSVTGAGYLISLAMLLI
jgi:hypothetical protein